jgi:hypothetical protein
LYPDRTEPDNSDTKKSTEDRDDLIFELIKRRYDSVSQNVSTLDTKAAQLIGFVSVVVGLVVGGGAFPVSKIVTSYTLYIPYFASLALLLTSISFGLKAFREKRGFLTAPDVQVLLKKYTEPNVLYSDVLQTSGLAMVDAIVNNERSNRQKARDINWSWIFLLGGLGSLLILLVLSAFGSQIEAYFGNVIKTLLDIISTYTGKGR